MSLNEEQIKQHCKTILKSTRILNKIVVLCEGNIIDPTGRLSPQLYGQMERMPDSNFYKACVPKWWKQYLPQFFNSGDRNDVLDTYFTLLELHAGDSSNSYLDPTKLFALIDLDLQVKKIRSDYLFSDTEAIFCNLYQNSKIKESAALQHRIWVTGLIHKEAYFLLPELQAIFDQFSVHLIYNGTNLLLDNIYLNMSDEISSDIDLQNNFYTACNRVSYCAGLDMTGIEQLRDSWRREFQGTLDDIRKNELVFVLLTIKKAKEHWNKIQPSDEWTRSVNAFKDQLLLEIGRFYSEQTDDIRCQQYHIPSFFKFLHQFI